MSSSTTCSLLIHQVDYSEEELLIGPELVEELGLAMDDNAKEFVEICSLTTDQPVLSQPQGIGPETQTQPKPGSPLVLRVTSPSASKSTLAKGISVLKGVAEAFHLSARQTVRLRRVIEDEATLDWVEFGFKDQHVTRGDIWIFRRHIIEREPTLHLSKTITVDGVRAQVQKMMRHSKDTASGLLSEGTKLRFRSRSAAFFVLVQMSREMWEVAPDGETHHEKAISFLRWPPCGRRVAAVWPPCGRCVAAVWPPCGGDRMIAA